MYKQTFNNRFWTITTTAAAATINEEMSIHIYHFYINALKGQLFKTKMMDKTPKETKNEPFATIFVFINSENKKQSTTHIISLKRMKIYLKVSDGGGAVTEVHIHTIYNKDNAKRTKGKK